MLTYAAITPARDEAEGIARLAECLIRQTVHPSAWIVVDDGSSDGTPEVIASLAAQHGWIRLAASPGSTSHFCLRMTCFGTGLSLRISE